ncbi:MAG: hypothetical protein KatS3mg103_1310 [Phycisphaerales bacterium]|nr:MAG: hypothetical protein KatS3mg103_1310 [Phycisphaerales bacterium]
MARKDASKETHAGADKARDDAAPTFEEALAEVEAIIERIESGQSGLEQSIGEYERGVRLLARCKDLLRHAEQRIEEVTDRLREGASAEATPRPDAPDRDTPQA